MRRCSCGFGASSFRLFFIISCDRYSIVYDLKNLLYFFYFIKAFTLKNRYLELILYIFSIYNTFWRVFFSMALQVLFLVLPLNLPRIRHLPNTFLDHLAISCWNDDRLPSLVAFSAAAAFVCCFFQFVAAQISFLQFLPDFISFSISYLSGIIFYVFFIFSEGAGCPILLF